MEWFRKIKTGLKPQKKREIPDNLWIKCDGCGEILYRKELRKSDMVCVHCNHHFYLSPSERIALITDADSFKEMDAELHSINFLKFPEYEKKIQKGKRVTQRNDAMVTGTATIGGFAVCLGVSDFKFMGASLGSVVGEKIKRLADKAIAEKAPLILVNASGGARMHEGLTSLMQMAKTSSAVARLNREGVMFISVLTHPTFGGVTASYATLGDVILAERGALIGFAGPRVIKDTIGQELPPGFQTSEFQLEHGVIDRVVHRHELKNNLKSILGFYYDADAPLPTEATA